MKRVGEVVEKDGEKLDKGVPACVMQYVHYVSVYITVCAMKKKESGDTMINNVKSLL